MFASLLGFIFDCSLICLKSPKSFIELNLLAKVHYLTERLEDFSILFISQYHKLSLKGKDLFQESCSWPKSYSG